MRGEPTIKRVWQCHFITVPCSAVQLSPVQERAYDEGMSEGGAAEQQHMLNAAPCQRDYPGRSGALYVLSAG